MDFLLDQGLNPQVPVTAGWTAANIAAWAEHPEVLAVLAQYDSGPSDGSLTYLATAWQSMTNFMGFMWLDVLDHVRSMDHAESCYVLWLVSKHSATVLGIMVPI